MTINYIKSQCSDFSPNSLRDKYYAAKHKIVTVLSLCNCGFASGLLFYMLFNYGLCIWIYISIVFFLIISVYIQYELWNRLDIMIIKNYYKEYITTKLLKGNFLQQKKEINHIYLKISQTMWKEFCNKHSIPLDCKTQMEIRNMILSSIKPSIIKINIIKDIIALTPLIAFTIAEIGTKDPNSKVVFYVLGLIIYIGILAIYYQFCNIYLDAPYMRYKRLLATISAEMADSPILFKK